MTDNKDKALHTKELVSGALIPNAEEFKQKKVKPPIRWFNSIMTVEILICGICIGISLSYLIIYFLG